MRSLAAAQQFGSSYEVDPDYDRAMHEQDSTDEKVQQLTSVYRDLLTTIDEDVERAGLKKTPERAAKAIWYFTKGYRQNLSGQSCRSSCFFTVRAASGLMRVHFARRSTILSRLVSKAPIRTLAAA